MQCLSHLSQLEAVEPRLKPSFSSFSRQANIMDIALFSASILYLLKLIHLKSKTKTKNPFAVF